MKIKKTLFNPFSSSCLIHAPIRSQNFALFFISKDKPVFIKTNNENQGKYQGKKQEKEKPEEKEEEEEEDLISPLSTLEKRITKKNFGNFIIS